MTIKLENIDQQEAWNVSQVLPPGWHNVRIASSEEGQSSGGHPEIELELESLLGEGRMKDWLVVTSQSLGKVRQLIEAAGVQIKGGVWEFDPAVLTGAQVSILVRVEPKLSDPSQTVHKVVGYESLRDDIPTGAGNGAARSADADIPFAPSLV